MIQAILKKCTAFYSLLGSFRGARSGTERNVIVIPRSQQNLYLGKRFYLRNPVVFCLSNEVHLACVAKHLKTIRKYIRRRGQENSAIFVSPSNFHKFYFCSHSHPRFSSDFQY